MQDAQIIRYTRTRKGNLNGCLVAAKIDGKVRIGYSKCHRDDQFDKAKAKQIAVGRLNNTNVDYTTTIPSSLYSEFKHFVDRCGRYFKK